MNDKQILELNQKHPYYTQLPGQMAVTGLQMGHFFVWSPKGFPKITWLRIVALYGPFFLGGPYLAAEP
jgi:hypothetical protein